MDFGPVGDARQARIAWSSNTTGAPNTAMMPSLVNLSTVPAVLLHHRRSMVDQLGHDLAQPLRPDGRGDVIEPTTSANSTVTCLYSGGVVAVAAGAPHWLQNLALAPSSVPHDPHTKAAAVMSRGQPTVVPRHSRVTAGQPASAISVPRSGQRVARYAAPRGGRLGRIPPMCEVGAQRLAPTSDFSASQKAVELSPKSLFRNEELSVRNKKLAAIAAAFDAVGIA